LKWRPKREERDYELKRALTFNEGLVVFTCAWEFLLKVFKAVCAQKKLKICVAFFFIFILAMKTWVQDPDPY